MELLPEGASVKMKRTGGGNWWTRLWEWIDTGGRVSKYKRLEPIWPVPQFGPRRTLLAEFFWASYENMTLTISCPDTEIIMLPSSPVLRAVISSSAKLTYMGFENCRSVFNLS